MKIDLTVEMRDPSEEEILEKMRAFVIYNIRRDKVMVRLNREMAAWKASRKLAPALIRVHPSFMIEMAGLFPHGRLGGVPVVTDEKLEPQEMAFGGPAHDNAQEPHDEFTVTTPIAPIEKL